LAARSDSTTPLPQTLMALVEITIALDRVQDAIDRLVDAVDARDLLRDNRTGAEQHHGRHRSV
jgi:hypothetical protein